MFKKISSWFKEITAPAEEVHYCLMCGQNFKGDSAFDLSEECTYSHENDTDKEREKYPGRLAILKNKADAEKEIIINATGLKESKKTNSNINKKRL